VYKDMINNHSNITVDQNRTQYVAGTLPNIPTDTVISILHTVEYRGVWWFCSGATVLDHDKTMVSIKIYTVEIRWKNGGGRGIAKMVFLLSTIPTLSHRSHSSSTLSHDSPTVYVCALYCVLTLFSTVLFFT
jgi:hypothetical protein